VRGSFLWRNRVLLASSALLILSLHLISTAFIRAISPHAGVRLPGNNQAAGRWLYSFSSGASGIVTNYVDLIHVREENAHLRIELARVKSDSRAAGRTRSGESASERAA